MTLQNPTPVETTDNPPPLQVVPQPLPYFSEPAGQVPLAVRMIRMFGIALGGSDIILMLFLLVLPSYPIARNFPFAVHRGFSPGISLIVETTLSADLLAASITAYTNRRLGRHWLWIWAWASIVWIVYFAVARTAYLEGFQINRLANVGNAISALQEGMRDAVFPLLTLAILRIPEIRAYFDTREGSRQ